MTDPDRLERAVQFLESHPDYSMHGCYYFREYLDGNRVLSIPGSRQSGSAENLKSMPFFQTSAGTLRNCWTEELLNELEIDNARNRILLESGDSLRNLCEIQFGKAYFDNFVGSVYTMQVGIFDSMSKFEKDFCELLESYALFEFARDFFHNKTDAQFWINGAFRMYLKIADQIGAMIKNYSAIKFQGSGSCFKSMLNIDNGTFEDVVHLMLCYTKNFESLGMRGDSGSS